MEEKLNKLLSAVSPLDDAAMEKARERQAQLAKPPGSLGRLEDLSVQLAGITGRVHNKMGRTHLLVFAADNGVVAEGVSSAPQSVTLMQTVNLTRGKTGASVLAKHFGSGITVCDVGVNADIKEKAVLNRKIAYGTQNIASGPAMTRQQAATAILTGAKLAAETDADALGVGEMGIGQHHYVLRRSGGVAFGGGGDRHRKGRRCDRREFPAEESNHPSGNRSEPSRQGRPGGRACQGGRL